MNIAVIDVAAESGGALSVLNDFANFIYENDTENNWYFYTSVVDIREKENIHNIKNPNIKKSWFHRLWWEYFSFPKLMKENNIDLVISLQNNALPKGKWKQIVYFHNVLLLQKAGTFSFKNKSERRYAIYSNILGPYIRHTWKNADLIIVQGNHVRNAIKEWNIDIPIEVVTPELNIEIIDNKNTIKGYIYPAFPNTYKNFESIIEAVKILNLREINVEIIFTIDGTENEYSKSIFDMAKGVKNIKCVGKLTRDEVLSYYENYGLIMTSKIESFGMPIMEAKSHNTVIVGLNFPYVEELTSGYNRSYIVPEDDLQSAIVNGLNDNNIGNYTPNKKNGWEKILKYIRRCSEEL